jgi:hypothetical protein
MAGERHPTQDELLGGAIRTIEEILAPELQTSWARASAIQLAALLRYTLARQKDDLPARQEAELRECLAALAAEDASASAPGADLEALLARAGDLLVHAQEHDDALAGAVRARLRPLLLRHTAEDLAEAGPLLQGFMTGFRGMRADAE